MCSIGGSVGVEVELLTRRVRTSTVAKHDDGLLKMGYPVHTREKRGSFFKRSVSDNDKPSIGLVQHPSVKNGRPRQSSNNSDFSDN